MTIPDKPNQQQAEIHADETRDGNFCRSCGRTMVEDSAMKVAYSGVRKIRIN